MPLTTSFYAALLALMFIALSINVVKGRFEFRIAMGDGTNFEVLRRMRAQANFAEYTPLFLILLGFTELNHLPSYVIHVIGIIFILSRIMHAYSLLKAEEYHEGKITAKPVWRFRGMVCTFLCISVTAFILIYQYFSI